MSAAWPTVSLGEIVRLDLNRETIDPSRTYPMVGVLSFARGLFDREPIENGNTSYKHFYRLKPDHIVMSQLFGWEGALALSDDGFAGKYLSPQFPTFLSDPTKLDRQFLGWLMRRPAFWSDLDSRTSGMGDRRRTLSPDAFFASEVPLPPLDEQRRIVARIEALAAKVEEARVLSAAARSEAEALARSATDSVYRKLKSEIGVSRLAVACTSITDGDHQTPTFAESGVKFVFVGNVSTGQLHFNGVKYVTPQYFKKISASRVPRRGDLLYSAVGATLGVPAIVDVDDEFCFQRHVAILKPERKKAVPRFLWHMLRSKSVFDKAWSSTTGSAQPTIPLRAIRELPVPLPPMDRQMAIVAELDALQARVDAVKALQAETADELAAMLPAILDKAFKGEL